MSKCDDCAYLGNEKNREYCRCKGQYKDLPVQYCLWYESIEDFKARDQKQDILVDEESVEDKNAEL